jgi:hypothetical protein
MNAEVRRKLEMVVRVRDFSRAHPSTDANYASVLARLEDRIARAEALAAQQRSGRIAENAAAARRVKLRRLLHHQLLRHLIRVGEVASADEPELAHRFQFPRTNGTSKAFVTAARAMLTEAVAQKDLLVKYGLAASLIDDLTKALDQYDAAVEETNAGRRAHVGARADLGAVTEELFKLVQLLDGLNQYRFRDDAEKLAAWVSAKNVVGPFRRQSEPPPAAGGVSPAA